MRVYITGGKDFTDKLFVWQTLDSLRRELNIDYIGVGDSSGVEAFAWAWAKDRRVSHTRFTSAWSKYGQSAEHHRNARGLKVTMPRYLIAFPGGQLTEDCKSQARLMKIDVYEVSYGGIFLE